MLRRPVYAGGGETILISTLAAPRFEFPAWILTDHVGRPGRVIVRRWIGFRRAVDEWVQRRERMQSVIETELPDRLIRGDEQVLEDMLRLYGGAILALLRSRFQGVLVHQDLEDVLSIALFRVWTSRSSYSRRKSSLKVWWYRIAENTARDVLRSGWQKSRAREVSVEAASIGSPGGAVSPRSQDGNGSGDFPAGESLGPMQMELREILAELPETQRRIILADASARDDVACSNRLADELGTSPGNVRVYRKRAMDRIRTELGRRGHSSQ